MEQVAIAPPSTAPVAPVEQPKAPIIETPSHMPLYELFKVEKSPRTEQDFSLLWEYAASKSENKDKDSILYEIIRLKNRLQSPQIGERPYLRTLMYVKEYMKMRESERKLEEMQNG